MNHSFIANAREKAVDGGPVSEKVGYGGVHSSVQTGRCWVGERCSVH